MMKHIKKDISKTSKKGNRYKSHMNLVFETFEIGVVNDNKLSVKDLLLMYDDWGIKKQFKDSLNAFDGLYTYKEIMENKRKVERKNGNAFESYFGAILKNYKYSMFDEFEESAMIAKRKIFREKEYTTVDALQALIDVWNSRHIYIEGYYYTLFEVYVAAWKWSQTFLPKNPGKGLVNEQEFLKPLSNSNYEIVNMNILLHSAKWLQGFMAEEVTFMLVKNLAKKYNFKEEVRETRFEFEQNDGADIFIGEDAVSIKSGWSLKNGFMKPGIAEYTIGPIGCKYSGDENDILVVSGNRQNGITIKHKGFVFDEFMHSNPNDGSLLFLTDFLKERMNRS